MRDNVLFLVTILAFASLLTAHLAIVAGLAARGLRLRALVALIVPPLAPYWAIRGRMPLRGYAWLGAAIGYVVARLFQLAIR